MKDRKKASKKDAAKRLKLRDLKPKKDAKGGGSYKEQNADGTRGA